MQPGTVAYAHPGTVPQLDYPPLHPQHHQMPQYQYHQYAYPVYPGIPYPVVQQPQMASQMSIPISSYSFNPSFAGYYLLPEHIPQSPLPPMPTPIPSASSASLTSQPALAARPRLSRGAKELLDKINSNDKSILQSLANEEAQAAGADHDISTATVRANVELNAKRRFYKPLAPSTLNAHDRARRYLLIHLASVHAIEQGEAAAKYGKPITMLPTTPSCDTKTCATPPESCSWCSHNENLLGAERGTQSAALPSSPHQGAN